MSECKINAECPPKTVYTVDPTDAPAGYIAVAGERMGRCDGCAFLNDYGNECPGGCYSGERGDSSDVVYKKLTHGSNALADKKLIVHSEDGNILLSFAGEWEFVHRVAVFNCADISAQEVAERLINCWNNYQEWQQCGN